MSDKSKKPWSSVQCVSGKFWWRLDVKANFLETEKKKSKKQTAEKIVPLYTIIPLQLKLKQIRIHAVLPIPRMNLFFYIPLVIPGIFS